MKEQHSSIGSLRRANDVLRRGFSEADLSMGSVQALLLIAETPAQPISWLAREMQMSVSGVQRVLLSLSAVDRYGRSGPALVEQISDPQRVNRQLLFLTMKGRALVNEALTVLTGGQCEQIPASTVEDFFKQHERIDNDQRGVLLAAYTPQQVATAKRSLRRKGIQVGPHMVAFPLRPARSFLSEIKTWLDERGGRLRELEDVGKPDGMALVELPSSDEKFAFVVTFRQPQ